MANEKITEIPMGDILVSPEKLYLSRDPATAQKIVFSDSVRLCNYGFIQFLFVSSGSGRAKLNGNEYAVKPGFFSVLDQGVTLELFPVSPIIIYSCSFLPSLFDCSASSCSISDVSDSSLLSFFFRNEAIKLPIMRIPRLKIDLFRDIFNKMILLTEDPTPAYCDLMRIYIAEFLIRVSECFYTTEVPVDEEADDVNMIRFITGYIRQNYAAKNTYESLARLACVSRSKLFMIFKRVTGKSIGDYIKMVRINQACILLSETDKSVYDIMLDVGYNDMKMFCKRFRECVEMTPTEYRKQYRKG